MTVWHLYVVRAGDDSLYTGIATDVPRRLAEHESGVRGSRYLRGRSPLDLVYQVEVGDRGLALRAERRFKGLAKAEKEALVAAPLEREDLLRRLDLPADDGER